MSVSTLVVILPWLVVAVGCWIGFQLIQQNGRIVLRLESLERGLGRLASAAPNIHAAQPVERAEVAAAPRLPVGAPAPEFALPDLVSGQEISLSAYRGRRILLIFFNPQCGFCTQMADRLAALPLDDPHRPYPIVVTAGTADSNRAVIERHRLQCPVLLQAQNEIATAYRAHGTPMGYVVDETGAVASDLAIGADALLALAQTATRSEGQDGAKSLPDDRRHAERRGNRSLADSKIKRDGLAAGTPAPQFRLPRLDGGEISLGEYRGRRVLLVFSDPHCGPCNQLAGRLQELHRLMPDLQVLMVSRGELSDNRQKVEEHGLTFPVALQKQWEVSKDYAMFATPIGYLIDEHGVLISDVAIGADRILALPSSMPGPDHDRDGSAVLVQ